ncbi:hypothetical protein PR048_015352 [Dryococelus australis]|uniref:Zinc finger PHD-type domain-containing protein n=1 Tax=Dryococelus australis TaxID=614101 RepID=A0ABQ9HHQ8_9NEOP|nr:hypothetical protein PR048_015352 [Dryococelus australis]
MRTDQVTKPHIKTNHRGMRTDQITKPHIKTNHRGMRTDQVTKPHIKTNHRGMKTDQNGPNQLLQIASVATLQQGIQEDSWFCFMCEEDPQEEMILCQAFVRYVHTNCGGVMPKQKDDEFFYTCP